MATVAQLLIKISADTSELRKQLNSTKRQIRSAFGSDFLNISNKAAVAIAGIGAAIAAAGVKAVEAAGKLQNVQTAFTNMLGSAQKAATFTKELQGFAAATPFEFNQVTSAAQKFLAFGFTAEQVIPTLTAVGDAAAGVGLGADGIDRVTLALGQMAAKSRIQSDEMLQLTEAGIPAWQMLADKIGKSVPEVMDMVSKGAVDAATGINALVEGMNQKFGGMMEQQSQTIQGTWSTLMDGIDQTAAQVGLRLAESLNLTGIFQSLGDTLNEFAQAVQSDGLAEAFRSAIPTEFQIAIIGIGTALVGVAIPAIALGTTALIGFLAPLGAAISAAAPFIAAAVAIATGLYTLWRNGVTVADFFEFFGIEMQTVTGFVDAAKSCFQQLANTYLSALTMLKPCFTVILTLLYTLVQVLAWILGFIAEVLTKLATGAVNFVNLLLQVVEWAANGINTYLNSIADDFMNLADSVLPEFVSNALKRISGFVTTAIGWLNNLISKIFETDDALSEAKGEEKKAPKAPKKLEVPKYDQFKNTAPTGATNVPKITGTSVKSDNGLLNEAQNTSKQIADEWYRTFSTKSDMVDRWYKEESDSLEKSRALNSNYEVDRQRLTELYAQKRLDALREEAKERDELINEARELGINSKAADIALYSSEGAKELEQMRLDYTKTLNSISDRWAEQQRNFTGMTEAQKNTYLAALKEYGVAYELNAQQEITFTQEAEKEKLAAFKKYQDERLEYYTQCKDIQADIDKAYATASYSALKSALSKENLARISAYNEAKTTMQAYYDATTEAHMSFKERMTNAITESQNSFQSFFSDVLTMQTSFVDGMGELLNNLFDNIVNQITAGWAASITQGALSFLMPGNGNNGGSGDGAGGDQLANFGTALDAATGSVNGLGAGVGAANGTIGAGTSLMGAYNGIQSLITGTTKPAEGAATTAVTAALTALATAATSASIALSAMSASSGFGFGFFAKGGVVKAAGGGSIVGAGTGTSDSIPAMLSNGEYVLTAAAVNRLGLPFLDKLNAGDFPGYAEGGLVRPNLYVGAGVSTTKSSDSQSLAEKAINIVMNISTMDAQSFQEFLERNGGREAIQQVAYDAERNFLTNKGAW